MQAVIRSFVSTFEKALTGEMAAMEQRYGTSAEMELTQPRALDLSHPTAHHYVFSTMESTEKLTVHMVCTLRHSGGETEVTITAIDRDTVTIASPQQLALHGSAHTLVLYPAFLYARLREALVALLDADPSRLAPTLRLFGKSEPRLQPNSVQLDHPGLNASQLRAVQLCSESNLAFIWGPPGTGKTTTLGHIVAELLHVGSRIVITSTTNAAIDQVVAQLAELDATRPYLERREVVRLGQASAPTFGTSLQEVMAHRYAQVTRRLAWLAERTAHLEQLVRSCTLVMDKLDGDIHPAQLDLFAHGTSPRTVDFGPIFSSALKTALRTRTPEEQMAAVKRRKRRWETLLHAYREQSVQQRQALTTHEIGIVRDARVVLTTTTNLYLSPLLEDDQFDVVIVEEASMAILPALFFSASLARDKVVIVGDPRQLPAIVQSDDPFVRKYLGMSIFDVGGRTREHDAMVMLDIQYRMHPMIGELVSALSYEGKLRHDSTTARHTTIAGIVT